MFIKQTLKIKIPKGRHLNSWQIKLNDFSICGGEELDVDWRLLKKSSHRSKKIDIICDSCEIKFSRRLRDLEDTIYHLCSSCIKTGDKNPQFGKQTSERQKESMRKWMSIKGNPFTWIEVKEKMKQSESERVKKISEKNTGKKRSDETKRKMSVGISNAYKTGKLKPGKGWTNVKVRDYKGIEYQGTYELKFLNFIDSIGKLKLIKRGPIIEYEYGGGKHHYFSDYMIEGTNIVFEIKSSYFWRKNYDVNIIKKESAESQYDYHIVMDNNFKKVEEIFNNINYEDNSNLCG